MLTTPVQTTLSALDLARAGRFAEIRDLFAPQLGAGPRAVPGTVTVPRAPGPHAGVVLLAGSGSLDRDETIGRKQPLKDIAWGLASLGIATIRFDKVTYAHADELKDAHDFTLADEYLPDAIAAIKLLGSTPPWPGTVCFCSVRVSAARSPRASRPPSRRSLR